MTLSLSRMASAVKASNDSAQSPAWSRKARPAATSARVDVTWRTSPANTSGGRVLRRLRTSSSAPSSGHSGCCAAVRARQLLVVQEGVSVVIALRPRVERTPPLRRIVSIATRLGLLGGTFDPVHTGHLVVAVNVRHALRLDRVLLVVANAPWQKSARPITPAADRLAVVEAAVAGTRGVEASSIEVDRGGESYTADTLEQLAQEDHDRELFLVVGAD